MGKRRFEAERWPWNPSWEIESTEGFRENHSRRSCNGTFASLSEEDSLQEAIPCQHFGGPPEKPAMFMLSGTKLSSGGQSLLGGLSEFWAPGGLPRVLLELREGELPKLFSRDVDAHIILCSMTRCHQVWT